LKEGMKLLYQCHVHHDTPVGYIMVTFLTHLGYFEVSQFSQQTPAVFKNLESSLIFFLAYPIAHVSTQVSKIV